MKKKRKSRKIQVDDKYDGTKVERITIRISPDDRQFLVEFFNNESKGVRHAIKEMREKIGA